MSSGCFSCRNFNWCRKMIQPSVISSAPVSAAPAPSARVSTTRVPRLPGWSSRRSPPPTWMREGVLVGGDAVEVDLPDLRIELVVLPAVPAADLLRVAKRSPHLSRGASTVTSMVTGGPGHRPCRSLPRACPLHRGGKPARWIGAPSWCFHFLRSASSQIAALESNARSMETVTPPRSLVRIDPRTGGLGDVSSRPPVHPSAAEPGQAKPRHVEHLAVDRLLPQSGRRQSSPDARRSRSRADCCPAPTAPPSRSRRVGQSFTAAWWSR